MEGSERTATCACRQLKIHCSGDPVRTSVCHCLECQKRTGSAFGAQARFLKSQTRMEGRASHWSRVGDEGTRATFSFCPDCGSTVWWTPDAQPEMVLVAMGAFAEPTFTARPTFAVYDARRHPWVQVDVGEILD